MQILLEVHTSEGGMIISHVSRPVLQSSDANLPRLARNDLREWMLPGAEWLLR